MFRRMKSQSVSWKVECEIMSPEKCKQLCPLIDISDIVGGLWIPNDGVGNPNAFCLREAPEIQNYLVAAGMKTVGMSAAGGVGRAIADIITQAPQRQSPAGRQAGGWFRNEAKHRSVGRSAAQHRTAHSGQSRFAAKFAEKPYKQPLAQVFGFDFNRVE
ncbi:hypothetical protein AND_006255 [Anopheles darlingi]|uniref:Uncharacterized protein n=1 Tax=Anopheles darlingi TaxID=43151 RepID=W5JDB2_ANODA|nr:hypothetical protein AND_006255 [Anopheles darlingi]